MNVRAILFRFLPSVFSSRRQIQCESCLRNKFDVNLVYGTNSQTPVAADLDNLHFSWEGVD